MVGITAGMIELATYSRSSRKWKEKPKGQKKKNISDSETMLVIDKVLL